MEYRWLKEDEKTSRRTVVDALEVLRVEAGFSDHDRAELLTSPLPLPSGETPSIVTISYVRGAVQYLVALPTAKQITGIFGSAVKPEHVDGQALNGALIDGMGSLVMADGRRLRAIKVYPALLPLEPSDLDWRIVYWTVKFVGAEQRCYRRLRYSRGGEEFVIPDSIFLDCAKLQSLPVPCLDSIGEYIGTKDPTLKRLSLQKIADSLQAFGIRIPKPRAAAATP